jgi:hypothetical protein
MMNINTTVRAGLAAASLILMSAFSAQAAVTLTEGVNYKLIQPAVPPRYPAAMDMLPAPFTPKLPNLYFETGAFRVASTS